MKPPIHLEDKVVLITGGSRGIGEAIARACGAAGARVAIASRKLDGVTAAAERLRADGIIAEPFACHTGKLDDVKRLVAGTVERLGRIDVVVNNAATALALPLGSFTPEAWAKSNDVNLRGPVFLVQAALPHLKASRGNVLNVLSGAAFMFSGNVSLYAGAKSALLAYTRSMAAEFAPFGVRANALAPGTTDTDMVRANPQAAIDVMTSINLHKRMAHPDEMVGPALLLTSDAGSFITGQALCVDGGMVPH